MKKPIIRILLSVLLVAVVAVGGTLAYLMASDSPLLNTFSLMKIDTEVEEPEGPGSATNKAPTVENTGTADVYVRAIAYVVMVDKNGNEYADPTLTAYVHPQYNTSNKWVEHTDGYYYYTEKLAPGKETTALFNGVTVEGMPTDQKFRVYIYEESVLAAADTNYSMAEEIAGVFANPPKLGNA